MKIIKYIVVTVFVLTILSTFLVVSQKTANAAQYRRFPITCEQVPVSTTYDYNTIYGENSGLKAGDMVVALSDSFEIVGCFDVHTDTYYGYMKVYGGSNTLENGDRIYLAVNGRLVHDDPLYYTGNHITVEHNF